MAGQAMRLVFRHDPAGVSLKSADRIDMRIPPAEGPPGPDPRTVGLFAELRSGAGQPLFTRALAHDDALMLEYPTGDPKQEFGRAQSAEPVLVSVLVPAHPEARSVALVHSAAPSNRFLSRFTFSLLGSRPRRRDLAVFSLPPEGSE
jgi:hypothetical protein